MKFNYRLPIGQRSSGVRPPAPILENIAQTRRPSFNAAGQIRGFRSMLGAAQSDRNVGASIPNNPKGGLSDSTDWADFFKGNSPIGVRAGYAPASQTIADAAFPNSVPSSAPISDNPTPQLPGTDTGSQVASATPDASGYIGSVISGAKDWINRNLGDTYA